jgi:hypothetical protein
MTVKMDQAVRGFYAIRHTALSHFKFRLGFAEAWSDISHSEV